MQRLKCVISISTLDTNWFDFPMLYVHNSVLQSGEFFGDYKKQFISYCPETCHSII